MRLPALAAAVSALLLGSVSTAEAQSAPVSIQIDECVGVDTARIEQVARLELGPPPASDADAVTSVQVECSDLFVLLRVNDAVTGKTIERRLDVRNEAREARARVLGVAISESVHASWVEFAVGEAPPAEYVDASVTGEQRLVAVSDAHEERDGREWRRFHLESNLLVRFGLGDSPSMSGVSSELRYDITPHWSLSFRGQMLTSTENLGRVDFTFFSLSGRLGVRYSHELGPFQLALDAGLQYTHYDVSRLGSGANDLSVGAGTWGSSIRGIVALPVSSWFAFRFALEAGVNFTPVAFQLGGDQRTFNPFYLAGEFGIQLSF